MLRVTGGAEPGGGKETLCVGRDSTADLLGTSTCQLCMSALHNLKICSLFKNSYF